MTSFRVPHLLPPYQQPRFIRRAGMLCNPEHWKQNVTNRFAVPTSDAPGFNWNDISANVVATVVAALFLSGLGLLGYVAYQVPRQQELILQNQSIAREKLSEIAAELQRLEANDRVQDDRLTKIESRR